MTTNAGPVTPAEVEAMRAAAERVMAAREQVLAASDARQRAIEALGAARGAEARHAGKEAISSANATFDALDWHYRAACEDHAADLAAAVLRLAGEWERVTRERNALVDALPSAMAYEAADCVTRPLLKYALGLYAALAGAAEPAGEVGA